jgi:hypothetical protein
MKQWEKPPDEEQLQQILTEVNVFKDSESVGQPPEIQQQPFSKRLLECHICKRIGQIHAIAK